MKREHCRSGLIRGYLAEQGRFERFTALKFAALALFLLAAWWVPVHLGADSGEQKLQGLVRLAQKDMAAWRAGQGCAADPDADPWQLGLIGVEMSPVTTTLGSLRAKRTACNPAWSVVALRLFKSLGLKKGDSVAVLSSSSFPGMILNVLAAAENMGLKVFMVVSLGSSTWGANHPACPWPVLAGRLRSRGHLRTVADFYTLGGGGGKRRRAFPRGPGRFGAGRRPKNPG